MQSLMRRPGGTAPKKKKKVKIVIEGDVIGVTFRFEHFQFANLNISLSDAGIASRGRLCALHA